MKIQKFDAFISESEEQPANIKYAPNNCKNLEDIKKGLEDMHSKFPNKSNMIVNVKIHAYQVVSDKLLIQFNAEQYFDSLTKK